MISRALFRPALAPLRRAIQPNFYTRPIQRVPSRRTLSYYTDGQVNAALLQTPPRPNTLLGRIRFRKDGNPRSKLVGFAFTSLLAFNLLTLLTMYDFIEDSETALSLMAGIIYTLAADGEFSSYDLNKPEEAWSYFKKLYQAFSRLPQDQLDELFDDLERLIKSSAQKNSGAPAEAQAIMKEAAEKIHEAFQDMEEVPVAHTANFVLLIMREALENLVRLAEEGEDDEESDTKYTFQLIKDRSKKDAGAVLKDYESLG
ncbi:hypothetical protein CVT24_012344 [Panaeolus cyanescens]|uniref:Uncharacterized protein n=1 Tax=Panaeolus cyanescens TaxID=181874 RepID=A0A409W6C1_9AGAR|nr:hypothetical protein CVT24_012344 [Panaeolus cyanescens]